MCKYKPSLTKIETFYIVSLRIVLTANLQTTDIENVDSINFYSCPAIDNFFSVTQKANDF